MLLTPTAHRKDRRRKVGRRDVGKREPTPDEARAMVEEQIEKAEQMIAGLQGRLELLRDSLKRDVDEDPGHVAYWLGNMTRRTQQRLGLEALLVEMAMMERATPHEIWLSLLYTGRNDERAQVVALLKFLAKHGDPNIVAYPDGTFVSREQFRFMWTAEDGVTRDLFVREEFRDDPEPELPAAVPETEAVTEMSHERTVQITSGTVILTTDVNPLALRGADREFVAKVVDALDELEGASQPETVDPTPVPQTPEPTVPRDSGHATPDLVPTPPRSEPRAPEPRTSAGSESATQLPAVDVPRPESKPIVAPCVCGCTVMKHPWGYAYGKARHTACSQCGKCSYYIAAKETVDA